MEKSNLIEKCSSKKREKDSLNRYLKMYQEEVQLGDYEKALNSLQKYEDIAFENQIEINVVLFKVLLERLMGRTPKTYFLDNYYGLVPLDDNTFHLYKEAVYYILNRDYGLAYEIFYYLSCVHEELDFETVKLLIERNFIKEQANVKQKKK